MSIVSLDHRGLAPLKELILQTCGFALEEGREQSLIEGLRTRMALRGIDSPHAYHGLLVRDSDELDSLVRLLTVNETYFFRELDHLNLVADGLLGEMVAGRDGRAVRILSAGCSSGEEPYSIAMMLRERYGPESERLFAITGVDIDASVVACAREGVYGSGSFRGMDRGMLQRYFDPCGRGEFRIRDSIRRLVGFEVVNLLGSRYPEGMGSCDVIFYRNVSIYFPQEVQRKIFVKLAGLLNEGGYLVVGATETMHHDIGVLSLVQRDALFCYRKMPALAFEERRGARRNQPVPGRPRPPAVPPRPAAAAPAALPGLPWSGSRPAARQPDPARQAPGYSPRETKALFDAALELACKGRSDQALGMLERIIGCDCSFPKACTLQGSLLLNAGRFQEAKAVCDGILSRDPLSLEAYLMLGVIARHQGEQEAALKRFREALYLDPACWLAHFYSAEMVLAQGDAKRARGGYGAALRILEKGSPREQGQAFFPLSFNAEQFMVICRHKLSVVKENG
ncbi:MAG: hypothetical protein A2075_08245 [Geobacteraceae bacterium GWC2_58_44]|nr:MAG: hypothetical protein A2075_08245 [Geobacteraceae bacterium GWC2_58_44]